MVVPSGFEPEQSEPKSLVLPLHHGTRKRGERTPLFRREVNLFRGIGNQGAGTESDARPAGNAPYFAPLFFAEATAAVVFFFAGVPASALEDFSSVAAFFGT